MDKPNYVLTTNETVLIPRNKKVNSLILPTWIIIITIIVISIIFQENLFLKLERTTQVLFVSIVITIFSVGGLKNAPSPIELRFYDEYLIVYRAKRYYDRKVTRMEYNKFIYKDVERCVYRSNQERLHIYGIVSVEWYNYSKSGEVPLQPTITKTADSLIFIRTSVSPDVDFISEIEKHTPIKVIIEDK